MKIPYGAVNSENLWWDGKDWRKWDECSTLRVQENFLMDSEFGTHVDGCFKCPRCRRPHFLPSTFDYLCDGCSDVLLSIAEPLIVEGILHWRRMAQEHYKKNGFSALIRIKENERDHLTRKT